MVVLSVEFTKNMTRSFGVFRQRDDTWRPLFDMICSAKMIKLQNTEGIYQFGSTLWFGFCPAKVLPLVPCCFLYFDCDSDFRLCIVVIKTLFSLVERQIDTLAKEIDVESVFPQVRIRRKKTQFSYEASDDVLTNEKETFKINFYYTVIDRARISLEERFQCLQHCNNFSK